MVTINFIEKYSEIQNFDMHSHCYWEILYVISGRGVFQFPNQSVKYFKGDIILIPPNTLHQNFPEKGFKNINMTITDWTPKNKEPFIISLENSKNTDALDIFSIFNLAYKFFHRINRDDEIISNIVNLITSIIDSLTESRQIPLTVKTIENRVISNFTDPFFTITAAYQDLNYSKKYLQRQFIEAYGISPSQFLTKKRIEYSVKFLSYKIDNDCSISEIAEKCGFQDQFYFSRVFKKQYNISPSEYRKRYKSQ